MREQAFVDETRRGNRYYLVAAMVSPADVATLRKQLRALLLPGQKELHFYKEKDNRRRQLADQVARLQFGVRVYRAELQHSEEEQARRLCVERLVAHLLDAGARRLVFDSRGECDRVDRRTLQARLRKETEAHLEYAHLSGAQEPILWVADAIGWCFGAGGHWRARIAKKIDCEVDCG